MIRLSPSTVTFDKFDDSSFLLTFTHQPDSGIL